MLLKMWLYCFQLCQTVFVNGCMIERYLNACLCGEAYAGMKPLKASIAITKPAA